MKKARLMRTVSRKGVIIAVTAELLSVSAAHDHHSTECCSAEEEEQNAGVDGAQERSQPPVALQSGS